MKTPCAGAWVWMGVLVVASLGATACAAPTCGPPMELCDGVCANLEDNADNCGACGAACGENEVCDNGTCVAEACTGESCGCESVTCPQGSTCAQGECVCSGGLALCEAGCTNLETDPKSCGSCDHACPESMKCAGGVCLPTCDEAGLVECSGVCTNILYDPTSCGSCGQTCPGGTVCIQAQCSCPDLSQSLCGGACVDTSWDPSNCGFCGHDCGPGGSCWEGTCECVSGETCGGTCVDTWSDPQNCGGCFQSCGAGQACVQGTCSCPADPCGICDVTELGSAVPQMVNGTTTGQPNHVDPWCGAQGNGDRVFRFVAPEAGVYTFDTFGSSFDTVLSAMGELSCAEEACNDDASGLDSLVSVNLAAGEGVLIAVDGLFEQGSFTLHITQGGGGGGQCDSIGTCQGGCVDCSIMDLCLAPYDTCFSSVECIDYNDCLGSCGDQACADACGAANPVGLDLYTQLINCVVCDACPVSCSQYAQACP